MLELGSHSKKLHQSIAPIINQTKIDKVFVKGKMASIIFAGISKAFEIPANIIDAILPLTNTLSILVWLIIGAIDWWSFLEWLPSSNMSPINKYLFDFLDFILSKFFIADFNDRGFEL